MVTTIQTSVELKEALEKQKFSANETYEEVIWDLLEDRMELSEQTKQAITRGEADVKAGRTISLQALKEKYGLK